MKAELWKKIDNDIRLFHGTMLELYVFEKLRDTSLSVLLVQTILVIGVTKE